MSCSRSMAFGITMHPQSRCQRLGTFPDPSGLHKSIHQMFGGVTGPAPTSCPFYHQRWPRSFRPRPFRIQQSNVHIIEVVVLGERGGLLPFHKFIHILLVVVLVILVVQSIGPLQGHLSLLSLHPHSFVFSISHFQNELLKSSTYPQ